MKKISKLKNIGIKGKETDFQITTYGKAKCISKQSLKQLNKILKNSIQSTIKSIINYA